MGHEKILKLEEIPAFFIEKNFYLSRANKFFSLISLIAQMFISAPVTGDPKAGDCLLLTRNEVSLPVLHCCLLLTAY
jgi:hypothetical protein